MFFYPVARLPDSMERRRWCTTHLLETGHILSAPGTTVHCCCLSFCVSLHCVKGLCE